jgi:HK97 gp10 family phage protein
VKIKIEGFRELERALAEELPKATARNVLRRTATNAMERIRTGMASRAPRDEGTLAESMRTQPVRAKRTRGALRFDRSKGVEVMTGPAPEGRLDRANAGFQEFGTVKQAANAYARPTADSEAQNVIDTVRDELATQIDKAKARIARKAARAKG